MIFYAKQGVELQGKLSEANNSTKHCLVLKDVVTVGGVQYPPILKPFVDSFLSASYPRRHSLYIIIWIFQKATRAFYFSWGTPNITPICLAPLRKLQIFRQCILKNHSVVPNPRLVRPMPPANIPRFDAHTHLVAVSTPLELVGIVGLLIAHREAEVCPVH